MKLKLTILFLFGFIYAGISQESPLKLSLNEAITYALEHNRQVLNAENDIAAAKKQKWEATATGLPQINAIVDYQNWLKQQVALIPAEFFGGEPGDFAEVAFGTKHNINATATLSQLIFDGSYLVGLQSAKVFLEISKNAKQKTEQEIKKGVIDAYGNALMAEESISILEKNKETLQKNLNDIQKTYENGLAEEESVEQLQITLSNIENNLNKTLRLRKISYSMLNFILGIDINDPVELTDDLESLTSQNINLDLLAESLNPENNIDFKIAQNNERSKELLLKYEKSKALPSLSAFINGAYNGYSNTFTFLRSDQRWLGSSLLGVSLNVPIFSSLERTARTQRAQINYEKAKIELTEAEQQLALKTATAKNEYQYAIQQYQTAKMNLALAERIEKKNEIKFFEGVGSSFDLHQAQIQLYTAQNEYLQSMLDVLTKKADLETILTPVNNN